MATDGPNVERAEGLMQRGHGQSDDPVGRDHALRGRMLDRLQPRASHPLHGRGAGALFPPLRATLREAMRRAAAPTVAAFHSGRSPGWAW